MLYFDISLYLKGINLISWIINGSYYSNFKSPQMVSLNNLLKKDDIGRIATMGISGLENAVTKWWRKNWRIFKYVS